MKKLFLLILILPFVIWAQEDSLKVKNQIIDEILKNKISNGAVVEHSEIEITQIDSIYIPSSFKGTVPSYTYRKRIPEPQYIIDGKYVTSEQVRHLNPNNIESVEIEKTGLYGTVIIQTKEGLTEYDLAVIDLGYENFLKMQPSAGNFSLSYLQNRNQRYVSLWNQRVLTGNPEIYEMQIDYDSENYYGLEFEHKLYMFFKFMEKKHSISMM